MKRSGKSTSEPPSVSLETLIREEWGRLVSVLIRRLGDFQLAEDCLQDAIESALFHWQRNGEPRSPAAWLLQTATRKAIDRIRRDTNFKRKQPEYTALLKLHSETAEEPETHVIPDERLSLIFTCCHPALDEKSRIALTLRTLGGLTTGEIARAFLDSEVTMAQRLVRAKQKIKLAAIPYRVPEPADLPERMTTVLSVIYLIFNEGYAATFGSSWTKSKLCDEAIRLAHIMHHLCPDGAEASGLLALMLLNSARLPAREGPDGELIPLDEQDRTLWDRQRINEGTGLVKQTLNSATVAPYLIQAAVSAVHCEAANHEDTDWRQITLLYEELLRQSPSPVIQLNRAIAISYVDGPQQGLALILPLGAQLQTYQPYFASLADLYRRSGHGDEARIAYTRAIELSANDAERIFLEKRRRGVAVQGLH